MADVFEQNLPQKSTLTMSDFIRVVGSDNVSYKQLVSDVAEKIINTYASNIVGKTRSVKSAIESRSDVPATTNGWLEYFTGIDFGTVTKEWAVVRGYNSPTGNANVFFYVHTVAYTLNADGTVNAGAQTAYSYSGDIVIYTRRKSTGEEWGAWQKLPTRAEIDALNSKSQKIVSSNTNITLSLSASSVYLLVLLNDGGSSQYRNVSVIVTGASGGTILSLAESAQVTTSLSGLSLTITRSVYAGGVLYKLA